MDSYHRSLNQGVFHARAELKNQRTLRSYDDADGTKFGNAEIYLADADGPTSFHAVAYKMADGSIVVSYRGTDQIAETISDVTNGWTVGAGFTSGNQATKAQEFYEQLVKKNRA